MLLPSPIICNLSEMKMSPEKLINALNIHHIELIDNLQQEYVANELDWRHLWKPLG